MSEYQEFVDAFDRLIKPRNAEEISARCKVTNFKAFDRLDVPSARADGWVFECDLGNDRVLLRKGEP